MESPTDLAATLAEIDVRVSQVKARREQQPDRGQHDCTSTSLAAVSGIVTSLMQFSSLPSRPGRRSEGRRGAVGSLVAAYEGAGDAEGGAMI